MAQKRCVERSLKRDRLEKQETESLSGPLVEESIMAKRKLRLLKRATPIIGICEGCLVQFKSIFTGAIASEAEIRVRFAAHKCMYAHRTPAKMHKAA